MRQPVPALPAVRPGRCSSLSDRLVDAHCQPSGLLFRPGLLLVPASSIHPRQPRTQDKRYIYRCRSSADAL